MSLLLSGFRRHVWWLQQQQQQMIFIRCNLVVAASWSFFQLSSVFLLVFVAWALLWTTGSESESGSRVFGASSSLSVFSLQSLLALQQNNKREARQQQKQNKSTRRTGFVGSSLSSSGFCLLRLRGLGLARSGLWSGVGFVYSDWGIGQAGDTMEPAKKKQKQRNYGFRQKLDPATNSELLRSATKLFFLVWARDHVDYNYIRKVAIQIRWNSIPAHCISCVFSVSGCFYYFSYNLYTIFLIISTGTQNNHKYISETAAERENNLFWGNFCGVRRMIELESPAWTRFKLTIFLVKHSTREYIFLGDLYWRQRYFEVEINTRKT